MAFIISIAWDEHKRLKIRDIHEKFRENVEQYVMQHLCENRLYRVLGIHKEPNIQQEVKAFLQHILENDCSIVVVDEDTQNIHAVALVKWMTEEWRSWTALRLLINSAHLGELTEMVFTCLEDNARQRHTKWDSLHLFYYHVEPELLEDSCFMLRFFNAISEVARHMQMPRVTYMALTEQDRDIIEEQGFEEIARVVYSMYIYKGRRPFDHLRDVDELYGTLNEKIVEPVIPFGELEVRHATKEEELKNDKKGLK